MLPLKLFPGDIDTGQVSVLWQVKPPVGSATCFQDEDLAVALYRIHNFLYVCMSIVLELTLHCCHSIGRLRPDWNTKAK